MRNKHYLDHRIVRRWIRISIYFSFKNEQMNKKESSLCMGTDHVLTLIPDILVVSLFLWSSSEESWAASRDGKTVSIAWTNSQVSECWSCSSKDGTRMLKDPSEARLLRSLPEDITFCWMWLYSSTWNLWSGEKTSELESFWGEPLLVLQNEGSVSKSIT